MTDLPQNTTSNECQWLSRSRFQELLTEYRNDMAEYQRAKAFINQDTYNDIKAILQVLLRINVFGIY